MVVSEPSGETVAPKVEDKTGNKNDNETGNVDSSNVSSNDTGQGQAAENPDADSGIEVKAAIAENQSDESEKLKTSTKLENNEDEASEKNEQHENTVERSPKSLKELSNNVLRNNSTSSENQADFADFESATAAPSEVDATPESSVTTSEGKKYIDLNVLESKILCKCVL